MNDLLLVVKHNFYKSFGQNLANSPKEDKSYLSSQRYITSKDKLSTENCTSLDLCVCVCVCVCVSALASVLRAQMCVFRMLTFFAFSFGQSVCLSVFFFFSSSSSPSSSFFLNYTYYSGRSRCVCRACCSCNSSKW